MHTTLQTNTVPRMSDYRAYHKPTSYAGRLDALTQSIAKDNRHLAELSGDIGRAKLVKAERDRKVAERTAIMDKLAAGEITPNDRMLDDVITK